MHTTRLLAAVCPWLVAGMVLFAQPLAAQDEAEQPAPAVVEEPVAEDSAADAPSAEQPAADEPAADEAAAGDDAAPPIDEAAADAFAAKLQEWRELLKQMRTLQENYKQAEEDELPAMRQQWNELVGQGHQMLPELRRLGLAAFRKSPGADRQLTQFLVKLAGDAMKNDRWETAHEMATALLEGNVDDKSLLEVAGVSAFVLNQYDEAQQYLQQASQAGTLSPQGQQYLGLIDEYRGYWAEEQKVRAAEAEADDLLPRVELNTTAGRIVLELFENQAPQTVGNFVSLVEDGFYDGVVFHRVLPNFMAQGGDPTGDGTGGPGYRIYDEVDRDDTRMHFRGSLSMANTGAADTGGSQFFLTFVPTPNLNKLHTVFGRVVEGMEVLAEIQRINPENPADAATKPTVIEEAKVLRKRDHEYKPTKVE